MMRYKKQRPIQKVIGGKKMDFGMTNESQNGQSFRKSISQSESAL
jgi:hypothetical protein